MLRRAVVAVVSSYARTSAVSRGAAHAAWISVESGQPAQLYPFSMSNKYEIPIEPDENTVGGPSFYWDKVRGLGRSYWSARWSGWIVLVLLAAAYYPYFGRPWTISGDYALGNYLRAARCVLHAETLLPCAPAFPYPPAFAAALIPFTLLPALLQNLAWYAVCVGSLVVAVRFCEAMAERLYPGATRGRNLVWLRALSLLICGKYILLVIDYQAHDAPCLAMIAAGMWLLMRGREGPGAMWLAMAAAARATPVIFLPYLLWKRRYLGTAIFVVAFAAISLLPDMIGALRGGHVGYFSDWLRQVAFPGAVPGGGSSNGSFWQGWTGPDFSNQSLRGLINRFVPAPVFGLSAVLILLAVNGLFGLTAAAMLAVSPRNKESIAIDGAILLIAMLALSPMTSRYHFIYQLPAVVLVVAAIINDKRMRVFGGVVLGASFILLTGTSSDLGGQHLAEFAYGHGFLVAGAIVLLAALAAMLTIRRPPGMAVSGNELSERPSALATQSISISARSYDDEHPPNSPIAE